MEPTKRVMEINRMLEQHSFKEVVEEIDIPTSTFSAEMARGDYVFIKRENRYFKFLRDGSVSDKLPAQDMVEDYSEALNFLKDKLHELKRLLATDSPYPIVLDKRIYSTQKFSNKNIKVNDNIYKEFTAICEHDFPYLKIQDLFSQSLVDFINKYGNQH